MPETPRTPDTVASELMDAIAHCRQTTRDLNAKRPQHAPDFTADDAAYRAALELVLELRGFAG